jgi:hypothetical protein
MPKNNITTKSCIYIHTTSHKSGSISKIMKTRCTHRKSSTCPPIWLIHENRRGIQSAVPRWMTSEVMVLMRQWRAHANVLYSYYLHVYQRLANKPRDETPSGWARDSSPATPQTLHSLPHYQGDADAATLTRMPPWTGTSSCWNRIWKSPFVFNRLGNASSLTTGK